MSKCLWDAINTPTGENSSTFGNVEQLIHYYQVPQSAINRIFKAAFSLILLFLDFVFPELETAMLRLTCCNPIEKDKKEFV